MKTILLSSLLLAGIAFSGCNSAPKTESEVVADAYQKALNGNQDYIKILKNEDIKKEGLRGHCWQKTSFEKFKNCVIKVDKIEKDTAYISQTCDEATLGREGTNTIMKKYEGRWVVPVFE